MRVVVFIAGVTAIVMICDRLPIRPALSMTIASSSSLVLGFIVGAIL